jgi:hypothetical protein
MGGRGTLTVFGLATSLAVVVVAEADAAVKYGLSELAELVGPRAQAAVGLGGYEPSNEVGVHSCGVMGCCAELPLCLLLPWLLLLLSL